jgi:hypothetical protein
VGPRAGLDTEVRGKILCPFPGSNLDHPVAQFIAMNVILYFTPKEVVVGKFRAGNIVSCFVM